MIRKLYASITILMTIQVSIQAQDLKNELQSKLSLCQPLVYEKFNGDDHWSTPMNMAQMLVLETSYSRYIKNNLAPFLNVQIHLKTYASSPSDVVNPQHQIGIGMQYHFFNKEKWRLTTSGEVGITKGFFGFVPNNSLYLKTLVGGGYKLNRSILTGYFGAYILEERWANSLDLRILVYNYSIGYAYRF